jgi:ABC-type nitrate/sulfonate/bicarbonate transport system ATPase subunit
MATLRLEQVSKGFSQPDGTRVLALDGVSLEVPEGAFLAILGASGCGKSTLLRIIAGLQEPDAGSVRLDGQALGRPDRRRGLVFQDPNLFPWLTVRGNVAFGPRMAGRQQGSAAAVDAMIELVGLTPFAGSWPHQLSGGMAQRVALARTLVNDPDLLLLDEPLGALDSFTRMYMQDELLKIWAGRRSTAILVTHDIDEAIYLADRVVIMSSRPGRISESLPIRLPRPRQRNAPEFLELRSRILEIFHFAHRLDASVEYSL